MKDFRAVVCGVLALTALVCAVSVSENQVQFASLLGVASTFGGYVVGLYSSPRDGE